MIFREDLSKAQYERDRADLWKYLSDLTAKIEGIDARLKVSEASGTPAQMIGRIEDLELWRGKVHKLLIETTPRGQEKLTKQGRGFSALYRAI